MELPPYTIIRPESFIQKSNRLSQTDLRIIEFNKFLNWHVQRDPRFFHKETDDVYSISSSDLHTPDLLLEAKRVTHFPNVKVMYHVDDEKKTVTLICIDLEN